MMIRIESGHYVDTATGHQYELRAGDLVHVTDHGGATVALVRGEHAKALASQVRDRHAKHGGRIGG